MFLFFLPKSFVYESLEPELSQTVELSGRVKEVRDPSGTTTSQSIWSCASPLLQMENPIPDTIPIKRAAATYNHHRTGNFLTEALFIRRCSRFQFLPRAASKCGISEQAYRRFSSSKRLARSEERRVGKECRSRWS